MTKANISTDVVVIGAGPAGYVCAIRLAQLGQKVTVVDRGNLGGVCLNVGCIPSKALIHAASTYEKIHHASEMGITAKDIKVDMKKLMSWKESVVNKLTTGVGQLLKANGCQVLSGEARFLSANELEIKSGAETSLLNFKNCVIAVGSRPSVIPGLEVDNKDVWDSTGALDQSELPGSLLCIGGGYIGLELGTFYAKLGVKVTVVEAAERLLGIVDAELVRVVEKGLRKRQVEIKVKTLVKGLKKTGKGIEATLESHGESGGQSEKLNFDKVLVTIGRTPNSDRLNLAAAGLNTDSRGFIEVDAQRRSRVPHIFAIGDIAGQPMLAHKGSKEGIVAAEVIAGKRSSYDVVAMPAVVFTDPEVATVGLSESEARAQGVDVVVGTFPFAANGRALSVMESEGMIKMIGERSSGRLLGVHIVGPEASNLIAEAALALEMGATLEDLASTVHAHPTLPEAMMEAAESALGHAVHVFQRKAPARTASPQAQV